MENRNFVSKYFWIVLIVLYLIGVLALIGVFLIIELSDSNDLELKSIILKSFIIGIPPMFYPIYKKLKN
jgi:hypothetical protein